MADGLKSSTLIDYRANRPVTYSIFWKLSHRAPLPCSSRSGTQAGARLVRKSGSPNQRWKLEERRDEPSCLTSSSFHRVACSTPSPTELTFRHCACEKKIGSQIFYFDTKSVENHSAQDTKQRQITNYCH